MRCFPPSRFYGQGWHGPPNSKRGWALNAFGFSTAVALLTPREATNKPRKSPFFKPPIPEFPQPRCLSQLNPFPCCNPPCTVVPNPQLCFYLFPPLLQETRPKFPACRLHFLGLSATFPSRLGVSQFPVFIIPPNLSATFRCTF